MKKPAAASWPAQRLRRKTRMLCPAGTDTNLHFQTACHCGCSPPPAKVPLLPSPREAAGRGWGWGVVPRTPLAANLRNRPPPPTPPHHARCAWEEGSAAAKHVDTVIASASEAIHFAAQGKVDCFVACAPRNDVQIQLHDLAARFARVLACSSALSKQRAQGMPGARCAPRSRVQNALKKRTRA